MMNVIKLQSLIMDWAWLCLLIQNIADGLKITDLPISPKICIIPNWFQMLHTFVPHSWPITYCIPTNSFAQWIQQ